MGDFPLEKNLHTPCHLEISMGYLLHMTRILLLTFLLLTSCYENKFEETLKSFVGKDYQKIVDYWGHPTDSYEGPNGNDVVYYYRVKGLISIQPDDLGPDGEKIEEYCHIYFEVGKDLNIIKYSYNGNYCWED